MSKKNAAKAKARREKLLCLLARSIKDGRAASRSDKLSSQSLGTAIAKSEAPWTNESGIDVPLLHGDLSTLSIQDLIQVDMMTAPEDDGGRFTLGEWDSWKVGVTGRGYELAAELEKSRVRRAFESNPPHWIAVLISLLALVVSVAAFFFS